MSPCDHDVIVLGAGPSGATTAIRLAEMGLDVALVEPSPFPRGHVGICVADQTIALMDVLGVADEVDRSHFWRRQRTAVRWGDTRLRLAQQPGYHVDRGVFDAILLDRARALSVRIYQPAELRSLDWSEGGKCSVAICSGTRPSVLCARYIVDASGRRSAIPGARTRDSMPLIAIHARWSLPSGRPFDGLIEAGSDAWLWYAQTAPREAVVSIFCDPRRLRSVGGADLQAKYLRLLAEFDALGRHAPDVQVSPVTACDAASHHANDPVTERYSRVGDACFCVDPLASQGVHLAIQSGLQAAVVVNTILRKPGNAAVARHFYRARVAARVLNYVERTRREYARAARYRGGKFWHERATIELPTHGWRAEDAVGPLPADAVELSIAPDLLFADEPVIEGDFIEVRQVIRHHGLDGEVRYLNGADLPLLLSLLPETFSAEDASVIWRPLVGVEEGRKIAEWLWARRLLVRADF